MLTAVLIAGSIAVVAFGSLIWGVRRLTDGFDA